MQQLLAAPVSSIQGGLQMCRRLLHFDKAVVSLVDSVSEVLPPQLSMSMRKCLLAGS